MILNFNLSYLSYLLHNDDEVDDEDFDDGGTDDDDGDDVEMLWGLFNQYLNPSYATITHLHYHSQLSTITYEAHK